MPIFYGIVLFFGFIDLLTEKNKKTKNKPYVPKRKYRIEDKFIDWINGV